MKHILGAIIRNPAVKAVVLTAIAEIIFTYAKTAVEAVTNYMNKVSPQASIPDKVTVTIED